MSGRLTLYVGPMGAGKSTLLCSVAKAEGAALYTSAVDSRTPEGIRLHTGEVIGARKIAAAGDIVCPPGVQKVCIDEAQFIPLEGLVSVTGHLLARGVSVGMAGLDLDSERRPFAFVEAMRALGAEVLQMTARCDECGESAAFTRCNVPKDGFLVDTGGNFYNPVCDLHWRPGPQ